MQIGANKDGDWGHAQITGWGYDSESKAVGVAMSQYGDQPPLSRVAANASTGTNGPRAFAPGVDGWSLNLSLYPVDGLQLNLGIPYGTSTARAEAIYGSMYLDASYILEEIGTVRLAAQFAPGSSDRYVANDKEVSGEVAPNLNWRGSNAEDHKPMTAWLAFHLTAIEGLGVELGLGFKFPYTTQDVLYKADPLSTTGRMVNVGGIGYGDLPVNATVSSPLSVGLGANFSSGDFGLKARLGLSVGGSTTVDASKNKGYEDERTQRIKDGKPVDHIPAASALTLGSDTFYEKYTKANGDVDWVPRNGTQEKKADPLVWGLNVAPSIKVGSLTVFINLGIGMKHYAAQEVLTAKLKSDGTVETDANGTVYETVTFEGKPGLYFPETTIDLSANPTQSEINSLTNKIEAVNFDIDWFVNPYVRIPAGSGQFYAGVKFFTDGTRIPVKFNYNKNNADHGIAGSGTEVLFGRDLSSTKYQVKWEIPIGFNWYF